MKTKTMKLYSFDELDKDVQQKLIERAQSRELPYNWYETVALDFVEEAEKLGFELKNNERSITFELYGRRSHFAVLADEVWFKNDVLEGYYITASIERGIKKFGYYFNGFPQRGWFKSQCRVHIEEVINKEDEVVDWDSKEMEEVEENLRAKLASLADLCKKYYNKMQKHYSSFYEEDYIKETLRDNGEVYLENGDYMG